MKKILPWNDVIKIHRTVSGISIKDGLVSSLLCDTSENQRYPNKISKDRITYYIGENTQTSGINALFKSFNQGCPFLVFEKMGTNKWINLGKFIINSQKKGRGDYISFELTAILLH